MISIPVALNAFAIPIGCPSNRNRKVGTIATNARNSDPKSVTR